MKKIVASIAAIALMITPVLAGTNQFQNWKHNRQYNAGGGNHWHAGGTGPNGGHWHAGGGKHWHGDGNNYWHGNNHNYWHGNNNHYYYNGGTFYQDPNFWGGVVGGLLGGAIVNQYQDQYQLPPPPQPQCRTVMGYVWVDGAGYQPNQVVVCN